MDLNLRYDFNALCEIENESGLGITEIINSTKITYTTRVMLWGGLLHQKPNLTVKEAGEIIQDNLKNGKSLNDISEVIIKALTKSGVLGNNKKEEDNEVTGEKN